jgi:peptide/nickel transport system substrate-binding protein
VGAVAAALPLLALVFVAGCGGSGHAATSHGSSTAARTATKAHTTTTVSTQTTAAVANPHQFPEFRIAMDEGTDYLDPGLSDTTEGWGVMWNVYLPLIGYRHVSGPRGARLVPYLATTLPRISHDGLTYRLTLRDGLSYSNGARVKASDFKTTIERDFRLDSAGAPLFLNIRGAEAFARKPTKRGIGGIEVDNKAGTIVIHLKQPQADFSNVLASEFAAPVPADAPATDTSLHPLPATGPYVIKSYQPRSGIVEERNPEFQPWRFHRAVPAGNPDRVTWDIAPDASVALHRVLSGKDDWMSYYQVPSKRLQAIEQKHESQLRFFTPPNLMYFFMNTQVAPFTSLKVRQAVNYAISRRALERLAGGLEGTTENVLPPGYPSHRPHTLYRHNLRKAIRLVHESGYWHWRKKVFVWNHDVPADRPFTEYLVRVLNRLGFRAAPKLVTAGSYWTTIGNEKTRAQIGFADFVQDYPHPLDWFRLLDGGTRTPTHNSNYANLDVGWVDRAIARLTRPAKQTRSVSNRWAALDRRVMRLAPWAPFLNQEGTDFFNRRVNLACYVNNVLYEFDYASICVSKK